MTSKDRRSRGRPKDPRKRDQIMGAARDLFFERGLEAVSVEEIARAAAVSKVTLYSYFPDKQAIFVAVVERVAQFLEVALSQLEVGGAPLREALQTFGERVLTLLTGGGFIGTNPAFLLDARRRPGFGAEFFEMGPKRLQQILSRTLAARTAAGEVSIEDPNNAAEMLLGIWFGTLTFEILLKPDTTLSPDEIKERVTAGVDAFFKIIAEK